MTEVSLGAGPPDTVLPAAPEPAVRRLHEALAAPVEVRREQLADVVRHHPGWPAAWAALGELGRDDVESYACFRVGYHRGLDALRRAGWRGSGYVRWEHAENRGFLRCLHGLQLAAAAIGEADEQQRCELLLHQCDPAWPPAELV